METLHNQELVATILEDNVANELTTIQDFYAGHTARSTVLIFTTGKAMTMRGMKSLQLVLAGLQLPLDLPQDLLVANLLIQKKKL